MRLVFIFALISSVVGAAPADDAALVRRLLDYRKLTRLTEKKIDVVADTRALCIDPRGLHGPHLKPGILLYANDRVLEARRNPDGRERYPVGSLLVKEKFEDGGENTPSIITAMEKIADEGRIEDWRFTMVRLSDRTIVREGFKVSCVDCHSHYARNDFVSSVTDRLLSERAAKKP